MRTSAELTSIEIPPHILHRNLTFLDFAHQLVIVFFTNRTTNDFANLREEYVGTLNSLSILVNLHVECFDFLWIVCHDDWLLEMFLYKVTLMLAGEVASPINRELKLLFAACHGFFQNLDSFSVRKTNEICANYRIETLEESLVNHLVKELEVVLAIIESPLHTILDEFLFEVHEVLQVDESNFRFNHPELCQVARCVGILSTECRTESVYLSECCGTQFTFELTAYCERSALAKEIIIIYDASIFIFL